MTNREKFTEIFGCEIAQHDNGEAIPGHCKILIASDRHFNDWLKQEYVPSAQLAQDLPKGCTDTISRAAAISICDNAIDLWNGQLGTGALVAVRDAIMALPSAQPDVSDTNQSRGEVTVYANR